MITEAYDYVDSLFGANTAFNAKIILKGYAVENINSIKLEAVDFTNVSVTKQDKESYRRYDINANFYAIIYENSDISDTIFKKDVLNADRFIKAIMDNSYLELTSVENASDDDNIANHTALKINFVYKKEVRNEFIL